MLDYVDAEESNGFEMEMNSNQFQCIFDET